MSNGSYGNTNINKALTAVSQVIWYENNIGELKFGEFVTIHQFAKFSSSPKFVVIRYTIHGNYLIASLYAKYYSIIMKVIYIVWIIFIAASQHVGSNKVIIINNDGNKSAVCCVEGNCSCSSLFEAFNGINNSTIVIITSESVKLDNHSVIETPAIKSNITITGNNTTIKCNNTGSVRIVNSLNFVIKGITWDQCGDYNNSSIIGGLDFHNIANLTIDNCTFQNSPISAVNLVGTFSTVIIKNSNFTSNRIRGINLEQLVIPNGSLSFVVMHSLFSDNGDGGIVGYIFPKDTKIYITIEHTGFINNRAVSVTSRALLIEISSANYPSPSSVYIQHSIFFNNSNGAIYILVSKSNAPQMVYFNEVSIKECVTGSGGGTVSLSLNSVLNNTYYFGSVNFISNHYLGITGGALFLKTANSGNEIFMENCVFQGNNGLGQGAAIYVEDGVISSSLEYKTLMALRHVNLTDNVAGNSIIHVVGNTISDTRVTAWMTYFVNNTGTALHLVMSKITFFYFVYFGNNTANNGAALYLEQGTQVYFDSKYASATVEFVNNRATQYGGAIYTDLPNDCPINGVMFHTQNISNFDISFTNNTAGIIGSSLYFNIHEFCAVNSNISNANSLLYLPYKFNYFENVSSSIVTTPRSLMLFFPNNDGSYIGSKTFFITNKILGEAIRFTAAVFDYFNTPAEPTQFDVQCYTNCRDFTLGNNRLLVDNVSLLNITVFGHKVDHKPKNVTLKLTSILESFNEQTVSYLIIEFSPCFSGYFYNENSSSCVCYNHKDIVECYNDYNEIKRGYWFGTISDSSKPTVSLCPNHYCYFGKHRKETRQGYCLIPHSLNDQCSHHRTGVACGECKPGYTLAYDSPDCINTNNCSTGMTILVIILTIVYWIAIVAVVFGLMYFQFKISSGYAYGIIYCYSVVDILLDNNPYVSDAVAQVIAILSSFAKLTPQLFGRLCFVEGLSGIDQQFIHYSHALAVSLILLIIVLVTRYSLRLTFYVRRSIIRIICLLLLLSYTSLASTSLQLLRPVHYPGYNGLYIYLSPDMKYFSNRHALYGVVAVLCGLIVVIGLPLFLLLEPLILSRWFSFVKIKPLLDQFQGCYKDEYRWFAAYYLICRQIIIIIVYFGNDNYYEMLYYLQTACVMIAMFHIWIQPYTDNALNAFDGVVLLMLVLVVNANTFTFLSSATSVIVMILILFPLIAFCFISGKKLIMSQHQRYNVIVNANDIDEDERYNSMRVCVCNVSIVHSFL